MGSIGLGRLCLRGLLYGGLAFAGGLSALAWQLDQAYHQAPLPQAILVLGGDHEREQGAFFFAQQHPELPLWLSSGWPPDSPLSVFQTTAGAKERVILDNRAVDTLTNFTTMVPVLQSHKIKHIYLVTSDYHMERSRALATLILGTHGIAFTPVAIASPATVNGREPGWLAFRDSLRALLWLATGYTGVGRAN